MVSKNQLNINSSLFNFINNEAIVDTTIDREKFWDDFAKIVKKLNPINKELLQERKNMQVKLDKWHTKNKGKNISNKEYKKFLMDINYIVKEDSDFKINTKNVDPEIASICGPQLVVPITNERYSINAVNARWGSLYDALYGTNVLGESSNNTNYDPLRGERVIEYAKSHLDLIFPLKKANRNKITKIELKNKEISFKLKNNYTTSLKEEKQIKGYLLKSEEQLTELVLCKNNSVCIYPLFTHNSA